MHGKNSRGYAHPEGACRAHAAATPSAWDDTEKQNPAAPAVRDDAVYIPTSPNAVPALAHFCQVQVGHSSLAPKLSLRGGRRGWSGSGHGPTRRHPAHCVGMAQLRTSAHHSGVAAARLDGERKAGPPAAARRPAAAGCACASASSS